EPKLHLRLVWRFLDLESRADQPAFAGLELPAHATFLRRAQPDLHAEPCGLAIDVSSPMKSSLNHLFFVNQTKASSRFCRSFTVFSRLAAVLFVLALFVVGRPLKAADSKPATNSAASSLVA